MYSPTVRYEVYDDIFWGNDLCRVKHFKIEMQTCVVSKISHYSLIYQYRLTTDVGRGACQ